MDDKHCRYCGTELIAGKRGFGICGWCLKDIEDSQKMVEKMKQPSYFNGNRDEYEEVVEYG